MTHQSRLGQTVLYTLTAYDAAIIDAQVPMNVAGRTVRNPVQPGTQLPAVVVADWGGSVNLRVMLDGEGVFWATSRAEGLSWGQWQRRDGLTPPAPAVTP